MRKIFTGFKSLLNRSFPTLFSRIAMVAVIILPLVYSALYLYAFWDPYNKVQNLPVAFVNQDEGYIKNNSYRNLGTELEDELRSNTDLKWSFVTLDQATAGLQDKIYYSYIVIPQGFTRTVMSVDGNNPQKANIVLKTREASNVISARIVNRAAYEISEKLGHKISEEYFNNIFVDSRTSADDLKKAVDGAQKLTDGLADAQNGSLDIKNGLTDATKGGVDLNKGLIDAYQGGTDLKSGINQAYNGSGDLEDGLKTLSDGTSSLSSNLTTVYQGAQSAQSGLTSIIDKVNLVLSGIKQMKAGSDLIASKMAGIDPTSLATGLVSFKASMDTMLAGTASSLDQASQGVGAESTGISGLATKMQASLDGLPASAKTDPNYKALLYEVAALKAQKPTMDTISAKLSGGSDQIKTIYQPSLDNALSGKLIPGASNLAAAVVGYAKVTSHLGEAQYGMEQIISQGLTPLASGQATLVGGLQQLSAGASKINDGANSAYEGSKDLTNGLATLTDGSKRLTDGIWKLSDGSQKLANGLTDLNSGSDKLLNGLTDASSGSHDLYTSLNDGYTKSVDKVAQAKTDKEKPVMANPVEFKEEMIDPVATYGTGFTPYFVPLSLWVGAMAIFLVVPSISKSEAKKRGLLGLLLEVFKRYFVLSWVGVVQAVVLCTILIKSLGLNPVHPELFYLFTILLALLSIAIFQFLVYLFGFAGDFIGVILLMLQLTSSGGSYPRETLPQFFITVGPYLPMTYAVAAFRDIISGNQIDVSSVFSLYGAAILILIALTALFKWLFSHDPVMIKQPQLALGKINGGLTPHRINPLSHLKITSLKLSREFNLSARHGVTKIKAARLALHQRVGKKCTARRTALAQKVSAWKRPPNRRS